MNHLDVLLLSIRWIHLVSATIWIGGSLFYLFIMVPALKTQNHQDSQKQGSLTTVINVNFKRMVDICLWTLVISGSIILVDRATGTHLSTLYLIAISVKLLLVTILISIIFTKRRLKSSHLDNAQESSLLKKIAYRIAQWQTVAYLGLCILFITEILRFAVELSLSN